MNAVIRYPGSKWSIAEWIISHFPVNGIILATGETTEVNENGINGRAGRHIDIQRVLERIEGGE